MKKITIDKVLRWNPCTEYDTKEKILKVTKGKISLTPLKVANLKIPPADKVWVLLRPEILGKKNYKEIGFKIADRAVRKHCLKCGIEEVEKWAKKWLNRKDISLKNAKVTKDASATYIITSITNTIKATIAVIDNVNYFANYAASYAASYASYAAFIAKLEIVSYVSASDSLASADAATIFERKWQLNLIKKYL
jgi:hypothetical protein